jgi:hypothetical protein
VRRALIAVFGAVLLAVVASGCTSVSAGGWIPSNAAPLTGKATFGLTARCKDTRQGGQPVAMIFNGQLQFQDHAAGVSIHGAVETTVSIAGTCRALEELVQSFPPSVELHGTYRSQTDNRQGTFDVELLDGGEPGSSSGDTFGIQLTGDITYTNGGPIQGGNVQITR